MNIKNVSIAELIGQFIKVYPEFDKGLIAKELNRREALWNANAQPEPVKDKWQILIQDSEGGLNFFIRNETQMRSFHLIDCINKHDWRGFATMLENILNQLENENENG